MAEAERTKVCPLCAETIKAEAKVCPYCHKKQGRGIFISRFDLIGVATCLSLLGTFLFLVKAMGHARSFASSRDEVKVLSSNLMVSRQIGETNVVVTGIITNCSNYSWRVGEFEIRFFDNHQKIVDAAKGEDHFVILPGADHAFRVTLYSRASIPEHASYRVAIRSASDPSSEGD